MKCIVCHGEEIVPSDVQEQVLVGKDIVSVEVRTPVCQTCGERYYDRRTIQFLEEFERKVKQGEVQLEEVGRVLTSR